MQFTEEHVNKRFQAHRFLCCDSSVLTDAKVSFNKITQQIQKWSIKRLLLLPEKVKNPFLDA
jgi:hypothetical protein